MITLVRLSRVLGSAACAAGVAFVSATCASASQSQISTLDSGAGVPRAAELATGCNRSGLIIEPGIEAGGGDETLGVELGNTSHRTIRIGGFPEVSVFGSRGSRSKPVREVITLKHRGPKRKAIGLAPSGAHETDADLVVDMGGYIADGTTVHTVTVSGIRLRFAHVRCTLGLDPGSTQVDVALHRPMSVTTTALARYR